SLAVLEQPVRLAVWQHVASTYLVCAEDRGTPAERQREFARRAGSVVELDAGHHPFLSQPAAGRDLGLVLGAAIGVPASRYMKSAGGRDDGWSAEWDGAVPCSIE